VRGLKNEWSYTSTPQYVFMAWCLVKDRDNFLERLGRKREDNDLKTGCEVVNWTDLGQGQKT
jgi:hypothetical protein